MASVASYCALTTHIDTEWMANNSLSISNIQKILGSICAEDFPYYPDYQILINQPKPLWAQRWSANN